jgi:hypothetical protein
MSLTGGGIGPPIPDRARRNRTPNGLDQPIGQIGGQRIGLCRAPEQDHLEQRDSAIICGAHGMADDDSVPARLLQFY